MPRSYALGCYIIKELNAVKLGINPFDSAVIAELISLNAVLQRASFEDSLFSSHNINLSF